MRNPEYTITYTKQLLYFEMFERNGVRHIKFTCSNKEILKAEYLK
jgi:hypothetical protein